MVEIRTDVSYNRAEPAIWFGKMLRALIGTAPCVGTFHFWQCGLVAFTKYDPLNA
jgi:hypothetical protein